MYNISLETYFDQYMFLSDNEYDPINLFLDTYNYDDWFESKKSNDTTRNIEKEEFLDLSDMSPLEVHEEEVKGGKGLKILTSTKLLIRLLILLAQIKARNSSCKLKNEIRQILILCIYNFQIPKRFILILVGLKMLTRI